MYPLVQIGPFRLSSGGLLLLIAAMLGNWLFVRIARRRGGAGLEAQAERCFYPAMIGAVVGARLWYGLFNWDLYSRTPGLFWALRVGDLAWPGAFLGGALTIYLWGRRRRWNLLALADSAALALPVAEVIAGFGTLLSGESFGAPTTLPWSVPLFGALRHPTQIYYVLASLLMLSALRFLALRRPPPGTLMAVYFCLEGLALLLVEALRADSLALPGGIRAEQVFGLALLLLGLRWLRRDATPAGVPARASETAAPTGGEAAGAALN